MNAESAIRVEEATNHRRPARSPSDAIGGGAASNRGRGRKRRPVAGGEPLSEKVQPPLPIAAKPQTASPEASAAKTAVPTAGLTLKQKLAEVRRRISYIQKRGHNERFNYWYVTAADLAGAVGDALAELEVVVVPRLESISHENLAPNQGYPDRLTRVVMSYSFIDVTSAEQLTVKVAGEGRDPGDKGPYKAMTGALKYALLQSFLIATGDDPEDERAEDVRHTGNHGSAHDPVVSPEQIGQLNELIEQTGTDQARMLEYFRISKLEEMTTAMYARALQALRRKQAANGANQGAAHA